MSDLTPGQARVLRALLAVGEAGQREFETWLGLTEHECRELERRYTDVTRTVVLNDAGRDALRAYEEEGNDG